LCPYGHEKCALHMKQPSAVKCLPACFWHLYSTLFRRNSIRKVYKKTRIVLRMNNHCAGGLGTVVAFRKAAACADHALE